MWVRIRVIEWIRISSNVREAFVLTTITLRPLPHGAGRMGIIVSIHAHMPVDMR